MSKKTAFDKTREQLGLPEREYSQVEQACFNVIAKKLPKSALPHLKQIIEIIQTQNFSLKQCEAGVIFLADNQYESGRFLKVCGVGVTYTDEEIQSFIQQYVKENPTVENFRVLSGTTKQFMWAASDRIKNLVTQLTENRTVEKPKKEEKSKKAPIPEGPTLQPLEQVYDIIPKVNRYEQIPEQQKIHEDFLKSINAPVLTRFPPEPNGYLHIGHAKSMFVNFGYAKLRGGKTYLRLDDTNPEKECTEYVEAIKDMMRWLGHEPFQITHASDYFDRLYETAEKLILEGHMYICDQNADQISEYREKKLNPPCRDRPIAESMKLFKEMRAGLWPEGSITLRLKIDMQNANPNMRDPIAYRIKFHSHQQTGDKWCIYPSYDFTHCLNDSFENITHSICTLEFNIRRESYDWLTHIVGGYRPMQWEFSRLNISYTMMSKRRLLKMVNDGLVTGWNDPRMPTLVGLRRRGFTASVINTFCQLVGVSRNDQFIDFGVLEFCARNEYERTADRCMAVVDPLRIEFVDYQEDKEFEYPLHPADASKGSKKIKFSKVIYIEQSSFHNGNAPAEWFSLALDQSAGLRYGPLITVKEVVKEKNGQIKLLCTHTFDVDEKQKEADRMKKAKKNLLHIHWISEKDAKQATVNLYEPLFKSEDPMVVDDWEADLNPTSLVVKTNAKLPSFANEYCQDGKCYKIFQFERLGFFVVDEASTKEKPVWNRVVALKSTFEDKKIQ